MALNVQKGIITAPTTTGNVTYSLPPNFNPKALMLWTTRQGGDGASSKDGEFYFGCATYDGGSVQEWYIAFWDTDAQAGTSDTARGHNTTRCLKGFLTVAPAIDFEIDFVSFSTGPTSNFVLNYVDAPASAIKIHYLVLGGEDIVKARCGNYTAPASAGGQDNTIATGWGQPDFLLHCTASLTAFGDANGSARVSLGFAKSPTVREVGGFWAQDAAVGAMNCSMFQLVRAAASQGGVSGGANLVELQDRRNWPVDGFTALYTSAPASHLYTYLALQGPFQCNIGTNSAPTAGPTPVVQDNAAGFAPSGALLFGFADPTTTTVDSTGADVTGWFIGGTDGVNEGLSAYVQNDAAASSFAGNVHSSTKSVGNYIAGTLNTDPPALQSEADVLFFQDNVRVSWTTVDTVAREYTWVAFGNAGYPKTVPLGFPDSLVTYPGYLIHG